MSFTRSCKTATVVRLFTCAAILAAATVVATLGEARADTAPAGSATFTDMAVTTLWTVPADVHTIHVQAFGGSGSDGRPFDTHKGGHGGHGGIVDANLAVTPGEQLQINVGEPATTSSPGRGVSGGGWSGHSPAVFQVIAGTGNGGGATYVLRADATPLVVAGGGGGGGGAGFGDGGDGGGGGSRGYAGHDAAGSSGGSGGSGSSGAQGGGAGGDAYADFGGAGGGGGGGYSPAGNGGGAGGAAGPAIPFGGPAGGGGAGGSSYSVDPAAVIGVAPQYYVPRVTIEWNMYYTTTATLTSSLDPAYLGQPVRFEINWTSTHHPVSGLVRFGTYDPATGTELPIAYWDLATAPLTRDGKLWTPYWDAPTFPTGIMYVWAAVDGDATHSPWKSEYLMQVTGGALQRTIAISPASLDFGAQPLGSTTTKTITVLNTGGVAWTLGTIALADSAFTVAGGTCGVQPLPVGAECTYDIAYSPTATTALSATLGLTDLVGNTTTVALTGSTIVVPPVGPPPAPGAPTIRSIAPASGPRAGGTVVTIIGTNLVNVTAVKFGSQAATAVSCPRPTRCTVTSPRGQGTADITVTTPFGTSRTVRADRFVWK